MASPQRQSIRLQGIPASPGIYIGRIVAHNPLIHAVGPSKIAASQVESQIALLDGALAKAGEEIAELQAKIRRTLDEAHAAILEPHLLFVQDPSFRKKVADRIRDNRESASFAVTAVIEDLAAQFSAMQDAYISSRAADVFDVGNRINKRLRPSRQQPLVYGGDVILLAPDLTPTDTAQMDHRHVKAFATEMGGATSHTAILAKGLEIPAVVGLGPFLDRVPHGAMAIVDGYEGTLILDPAPAELARARARRRRRQIQERDLQKLKDLPAETIDGYRVELSANLDLPEEAPHVLAHGANGIGLFRTEFLYMNRHEPPSEDEQYEAYRATLETVAPGCVIFRTLDIGGDKFPSAFAARGEANPFLGLRAIRFCLQHPEVFKTQLRALLRASAAGRAKIMFPMVSSVGEAREARRLLEEARMELAENGLAFDPALEIGVMIEIPSAALIADQLAEVADFFSIGTNDLIQYTLAVDRSNERVAKLYDPFHPAVLRLIRRVIDAAHRAGIWVGVCGEMASDPLTAMLLVGMGIDELSMGALSIPEIKYLIRNVRLSEARRLAADVYALGSSAEVRARVDAERHKIHKSRIKGAAPAAAT